MKRAARKRDKTPASVLSSIMSINPASARTAPVIVESLNVLSFEIFSPIAGLPYAGNNDRSALGSRNRVNPVEIS